MSFEDVALYFDASLGVAEGVTLAGLPVSGIFEEATELNGGDVITVAPTLLLQASAAPAAAEGQPLVRGARSYTVRQVLPEPLDSALIRLVLARS